MCNFSLGQCSWGQIIRKALRVNFQEILSGGNFPGVIIQEAIIRGQFSSGVVVRGDNFPQGQLSSGVIFWTAITWGQSSGHSFYIAHWQHVDLLRSGPGNKETFNPSFTHLADIPKQLLSNSCSRKKDSYYLGLMSVKRLWSAHISVKL